MGQQEFEDDGVEGDTEADDDNSLFVPETKTELVDKDQRNPFSMLDPQANAFIPTSSISQPFLSSSRSFGKAHFTGFNNNTNAPESFSGNTVTPASTSIFGNNTSFKTPFGSQSTATQPNSSIFTSPAATMVGSTSSFGMPSYPADAPSSSALSGAPSAVNNSWPPAGVNGVVNFSELPIHLFSAFLLFPNACASKLPFLCA